MFALVFWLSRRQLLSLRYALGWMGVSMPPRARGHRARSGGRRQHLAPADADRACSSAVGLGLRAAHHAAALDLALGPPGGDPGAQRGQRAARGATRARRGASSRRRGLRASRRCRSPCNNADARVKFRAGVRSGSGCSPAARTGIGGRCGGAGYRCECVACLVLCLALFAGALAVIVLAALDRDERSGRRDGRARARPLRVLLGDRDRRRRRHRWRSANTPAKVLLKNKFAIGRLRRFARRGADALQSRRRRRCRRAGTPVTTPITNPDAHLVCRAIKSAG